MTMSNKRRGNRLKLKVSGNPDVFKEAEGVEGYARGDLKKRGGKVAKKKKRHEPRQMVGGEVKARADRARRGGKRRAAGGSSTIPVFGGGFGSSGVMPYSGGSSYVPTMGITRDERNGLGTPPLQGSDVGEESKQALNKAQAQEQQQNQQNMQGVGQLAKVIKQIRNPSVLNPNSGDVGTTIQDLPTSGGLYSSFESRGGTVRRKRR